MEGVMYWEGKKEPKINESTWKKEKEINYTYSYLLTHKNILLI